MGHTTHVGRGCRERENEQTGKPEKTNSIEDAIADEFCGRGDGYTLVLPRAWWSGC